MPDPTAATGSEPRWLIAGKREAASMEARVQPAGGSEALAQPGNRSEAVQLDLFADRVALERDIDHASEWGRFSEARRLRDTHRETYGAATTAAALGFLDSLDRVDWERASAAALFLWETIDARIAPSLRRTVRRGVFRRLLASHAPAALVQAHPRCLGALVAFLAEEAGNDGAAVSGEARRLVRDALLAGRSLDPAEIEGDAPMADLLAEDMPPRWLACLGGVRGLWPVPPAAEHELERFDAQHGWPEDEARRFWQCLRVARTPGCPEPLRHEARRQMKTLHPALHAACMRRAASADD